MPKFVIHKHNAKKAGLHYDIRIQVRSYLESYACKKTIPLKPGLKRLVIRQPNHNIKWLTFEGEIEDGYGAGKLEIWDTGDYEVVLKKPRYRVLNFQGRKIKGEYVLLKLNGNNYLFFKKKET